MSEELRCECGFVARGTDEADLAAEVRRHAWHAHRMALSSAAALELTRHARLTARRLPAGPPQTQEDGT